MDTVSKNKPGAKSIKWNRIGYAAFVVLSLYFLCISKDLGTAVSNGGIALIFDPFDENVRWNDRPRWQKVWLLVHVTLVFAGFIVLMVK